MLLYEFLKDDAIQWRPYLDVLPNDDRFDTLVYWSDGELEELQASAIRGKIGKTDAEEMFRRDILPVIEAHPDVFYPQSISAHQRPDQSQLIRLCHRMASTIMAYAFDSQSESEAREPDEEGYVTDDEDASQAKVMLPLADLLNADVNFNAHVFSDERGLTMRTTRDVHAGEELLNDYGPLPRAELLRRYGYITDRYSAYDVVEIPLSLVLEHVHAAAQWSDADLSARMDTLVEDDLAPDGFILERQHSTNDSSNGEDVLPPPQLPDELFAFMQTMLAPPSSWKKWTKKLDEAEKASLRQQASGVLQDILLARLQQYSTSVAQDRELLISPMPRRQRFAVEVRLGEKSLLEETLQQLELSNTMDEEDSEMREVDERAPKRRKLG